jgi:[protein-PII] uridylyltransferase
MPERYRRSFDGAEMREHAGIVARRGDAPAHAELWRRLPNGGAVLCVVAEDRPGLLSFVSAALSADKMDVVSAQAYTRTRAGKTAEAVDLLWVRREGEAVRSADAMRVAEVLRDLVTGKIALDSITRQTHPSAPATIAGAARVTFSESSDDGPSVLLVEAVDRPGLLLAITLALFRASVQIVASDATTNSGGVVDRFTIAELDGSAITRHRRGAIQTAVQAALDALAARANGT